ncbi:Methyltransferase type 11 [Acidisarcina polymorpha]|uniref:Methyltransferase type 11 n=1 Tax=Acidisarcina polymorpha TaxID=2211140 RepID=A0A2Z5G1T0_9BACT|nr:class I SAM-dependent methyltransferase [Acidisarcina polymorpha]AXC13039.1 Methyltransferase type 11 [Acidisarcina polymorpha]
MSSNLLQLKQAMRATWMAGDFGQIARYMAGEAEKFVERIGILPGMKLLDVACGTGNVAIPAARAGAQVAGIDIAPNLLEQARQRALAANLQVTFEEGDAEQLPYSDEHFDVVTSMFGAMFAPNPERVAAELARVCRRGGKIAMANWTPEGMTGQMFRLRDRYLTPPADIPVPVLWGDEDIVRDRLGAHGVHVETTRYAFTNELPFPPREVVHLFREYFGPTKTAFAKLDAAAQAAYAEDLERLWSEHNEDTTGKTKTKNEYLLVIGTRL